MEQLLVIDKIVFLFLNRDLANPVFDVVMPFITNKHHFLLPVGILALYLLIFGGPKGRITVLLTVITITLSDQISSSLLKPLIHRLRPCHPEFFVEGGRFLIGFKKSLSFPSSHAANMAAFAALLSGRYPRIKWIVITLAVLVAYSRVYVGVHYPLDVIGGAVVGVLCGWAVFFAENRIRILLKKETGSECLDSEKGH